MENTGKTLFADESAQWFIAVGDKWIGPLSASDVYQKILGQEIGWAHFIWKNGFANWQRVCDVADFKAVAPHQPAQKPTVQPAKKVVPVTAKNADERSWFLFYNNQQTGPFSDLEIQSFLNRGKITSRVHAWRDGMGDWERIEKIKSFSSAAKAEAARPAKRSENNQRRDQRFAPRRPLVARILLANDDAVITGVCRDISVGGMQVLTDRLPGVVGSKIKMNVSAAQFESEKQIQPFVAQGLIVRVLEDGRGFSFRFDKLPAASKRAIESYIDSNP